MPSSGSSPAAGTSSPASGNTTAPSTTSSTSAFRRLPTLGLSKPRSPFKRSTAPSPVPVSGSVPADLAPGGVNELAGLATADGGYERRGKDKERHRQASASVGGLHLGLGGSRSKERETGGLSSLLGAVGLGSPSSSHGSHASNMQALRNGGRASSDRDKVGTASMPVSSGSGGWLAGSGASVASTIGRRSTSRRPSASAEGAGDASSAASIEGADDEVVDIGFDTGPSSTPARTPTHERTPTRERANPLVYAYAFPPRAYEADPLAEWQAARRQRPPADDDATHPLAPPALSAAAKRRSIVAATAAHEAATAIASLVNTNLSATTHLPELGLALPVSPAEAPPRQGHDGRETIRAKRRSQRIDPGEPLPDPPTSAPGDMSPLSRLPQADPSRRPSYEPPLPPPPDRPARSRQGSASVSTGASASASRAASRKPSRSGDDLAGALEERLAEQSTAPAIPRRNSSNRLRRRASTTDGSGGRPAAPRIPASDVDQSLSAETPDGTASSSGENIETSRGVRTHARQSSRSRRAALDPFQSSSSLGRPLADQSYPTSPLPPVRQNGAIQASRSALQQDESADALDATTLHGRPDGSLGNDGQRSGQTDSSSGQRRARRQTEGEQTVTSPSRARAAHQRSQREEVAQQQRVPLKMALPNNQVPRAPKSAMYFYHLPFHGIPPPQPLRAHTSTLVGQNIYVIGGTDTQRCWKGAAKFDTETLGWSVIDSKGDRLPRLRAHSATLVSKTIYIFGGGDGAIYSNDVWALDTITDRWYRPKIGTHESAWPPTRRAHTAVLHEGKIVVFGGGNGQAALNDVWALDVSDPGNLTWTEWQTKGDVPPKKGYHTANLIGHKMIVYGGSDGKTSFSDVHVLDLKTLSWTLVKTVKRHSRLSHTATQVGSFLFVVGGHDGQNYAQEMLLLNLVTLAWESKTVHGQMPSGRGYHTAISHDSRLFVMGGYNGVTVFDDIWCLELAASAYLPQVTAFEIDETFQNEPLDDEATA